MSLHLLTILTNQSYISELFVVSQFHKSRIHILFEVIPLQTKFFWPFYRRSSTSKVENNLSGHKQLRLTSKHPQSVVTRTQFSKSHPSITLLESIPIFHICYLLCQMLILMPAYYWIIEDPKYQHKQLSPPIEII